MYTQISVLFYILTAVIKNVPTIIYFPAIMSIKLLTQLLIILCCLYFMSINSVSVLVLLKFYKKLPITIKFVMVNKFLLYNKLAMVHVSIYLITLIYISKYRLLMNSSKISLAYYTSLTFFLGIIWSSQEILWGGF